MLRLRPKLGTALFLVLAGAAATSVPRQAHATIGGGLGVPNAFSLFLYNVCSPLGGTLFSCTQAAIRVDPTGTVRAVSMTIDYDPPGPQFTFNAALSGPLCNFSVGGSCPPATPGVGIQPLPIFAALPDVAGAPLPGSTLTVVDTPVPGFVTMTYTLAAPIAVPTETNFFLFVFDYIVPFVFDASNTVVSYLPDPGADFKVLSTSCDSGDPTFPTCGSTQPAFFANIISGVPEPSTTTLLATGAAALALTAGRRRRGARRPS